MSDSRTSNSLKNAGVSLFFYFLYTILGFFSRKAFFDYLGSEILGLNTTAGSILGLLNLTELGIGNAVGYFLYKPLFEKDRKSINEIISLQGWLYRRVAYIILGASALTLPFFPMIFAKSSLPLYYAYTTFFAFLLGGMLSYFFNYKQIVLAAAQKSYKLQTVFQTSNIVKVVAEILAITYSPYPYWAWLSIEIFMSVAQTVALQILIRREYPWLCTSTRNGRALLKKYSQIWVKTKQIFVHKIGLVALSQCSPLVIYGFTNLSIVALYGNYILIVGKIGNLIRSVFDSTAASIGNLVASGDKKKIVDVFWELFDSRFMMAIFGLLCLYFLTQPFITLWLGKEYLLSDAFLALYILYNSIYMTRSTVDNFLGAYGMFQDTWAPLVEAALNIGLSVLFGFFWSLNGIIFGMMLSQILIISIWKPYFLFTQGFHLPPSRYFLPLVGILAESFAVFALLHIYFNVVFAYEYVSIPSFVLRCLHVGIICAIVSFAVFYSTSRGTRAFVGRMVGLCKGRWK